ncbi:MAG: IS4 family transposase [Terriglobia bacterium]
MQSIFSNALSRAVAKHIGLSTTRRETLSWLALLVMQHGTISLWRLAAYVATAAQTASVQRRFYRFFQYVRLDGTHSARVVVELLGLTGKPWVLAIDRTNWDFGKTTINILMISVAWNGMGIPLLWMLLPTAGNSNTSERTQLLDRLRAAFPDLKIAALMGDREFIGDAWMAYLQRDNIAFILRLRENQFVLRAGYVAMPISAIARHLKVRDTMIVKGSCRLGGGNEPRSAPVRLAVMRLASGELLALACSGRPRHALVRYRQRWTIETMFGNLKTKGFVLEATHLTDPDKLATLLALMAFAVALAVKTGVAMARLHPIPIKKHGRRAWSLFALGLNMLRKIFVAANPVQIIAFLKALLSPKLPIKPLRSLAFQ